jgi:hypothetical protein
MTGWLIQLLFMAAAGLVFLGPTAPSPGGARLLALGFGVAAAWLIPAVYLTVRLT